MPMFRIRSSKVSIDEYDVDAPDEQRAIALTDLYEGEQTPVTGVEHVGTQAYIVRTPASADENSPEKEHVMNVTERVDYLPFAADNCVGYSEAEMDRLNTEFLTRWNGWDVPEESLFRWPNGSYMNVDEARKAFQEEVAHR